MEKSLASLAINRPHQTGFQYVRSLGQRPGLPVHGRPDVLFSVKNAPIAYSFERKSKWEASRYPTQSRRVFEELRIVSSEGEIALDQLSDEDIVALCKQQLPDELEAFTELVKRYEGLVYNFCMKIIGSPQDAEEVAQDALIQVFHKIHQFEGRSAFKTWLYKIVHNYCRNRISKIIRKRKAQEAYEEHVNESDPQTMGGSKEQIDNKARIQEALNHLKPKDKEIITFKFMLGMTLQEISDTLGVGVSAAKMRYYRAMESFKEAFERTGKSLPVNVNPSSQ